MSMASKVLATSATFFAVAKPGSYFSRDPKLMFGNGICQDLVQIENQAVISIWHPP
jgi:hypothetical protein